VSVVYASSLRIDEGTAEREVAARYEQLIEGWNSRDAGRFAEPFAESATAIGFDGSEMRGRDAIATELTRIFDDHQTARYVVKVRSVEPLGDGAAVLRSVVGMIPAGGSTVEPEKNAHQTVIAARAGRDWRIVLLQNTPAQYHGRPELVDRLTAELQDAAGRA
jgi:uncharacterized protein (TIGR02246 family)